MTPAWYRKRNTRTDRIGGAVSDAATAAADVTAASRQARAGVPAWWRRIAARRGYRVGDQVVWTPASVGALIDRVHARYQALAMAIATAPTEPDPFPPGWRDAWAAHYRAWLDFREAGDTVWGRAWGATASDAQAFDQELDAWRAAYAEHTGDDLPMPLASDTADQGRPSGAPSFLSGLMAGTAGGATLALVGVALLAFAAGRR